MRTHTIQFNTAAVGLPQGYMTLTQWFLIDNATGEAVAWGENSNQSKAVKEANKALQAHRPRPTI